MTPDTAGTRERSPEASSRAVPQTSPRRPVYVGLLDHVTATSLDQDYAAASRRRAARTGDGDAPGRRRRDGTGALVALAAFGLLVTTAAVQTAREAPTQQRSRASLVAQAREERVRLEDAVERVRVLQDRVDELQQRALRASGEGRALRDRLERLRLQAGLTAARGPGLRLVVDDNPRARSEQQLVQDKDLQRLVNGLWDAGAETVAINGQRLTALSAIRYAGEAITVNFRSLSHPYVIVAIGDPDTLPARFVESESGSQWLDVSRAYGLRFEMTSEESLTVPPVSQLSVRVAEVAKEAPR